MGYDVSLKQCGSIYLAQIKDRMIALKRRWLIIMPDLYYVYVWSKI